MDAEYREPYGLIHLYFNCAAIFSFASLSTIIRTYPKAPGVSPRQFSLVGFTNPEPCISAPRTTKGPLSFRVAPQCIRRKTLVSPNSAVSPTTAMLRAYNRPRNFQLK